MATQKLAGRLFSNGAGGGTWTLSNGLAGTFTTKTYSYITLPDGSIKVDYTQEIKDSAGGLIAEHAGSFTSTDPTKLSGSYNGAWSVETTGNNSYSYNNYRDGILIGGGNFTTNYPLFVKSAQASSALISQYRPKEVFGSNAQDTISSKSSEGVWGLGGNDNLSTNSGTFGSFLVGGSGSDNYLVTGNSGAIIFELPNQGSDKLTLSNISLESQTSYVGTVDDRHVFAYDTSGQFVMVVDGLQSGGIDTIQLGNQTYSYDYIKTNLRQLPNFLGNLSWSQYDQQLEGGILALQGLNKTSIDQLIQEVARVAPLLEASGGPVSTYSLTTTSALLNEGATITTTATTTNVASGITLYYALSGTGISSSDFSAGALTGSGTVGTDGKFSFSHTLANDLTTEGTESLEIKLFSDSARTTQVGSTASVTIADTSTTPAPTYSLSTSAASINEGATLTTTAATTNVASGTTLYYALSGTGITASDFSAGALTGSGTVGTDGKFSFSHTLSNDLTTEGAEIILIGLYTDAGRLNQIAKAETLIIDRQRESASLLKSKPAEADRLSLNFILAPSQRISLGNGDPFRTSGERMSYQRAYLDSDLNYIIDGQATSSNRPTSLAQWKKVIYRVTTPGGAASLIDLDALLYSRYGQWRTIAGTLSYTTSENVDSIDKAYIRLDVKDPVSGSHTIYDLEIGDFATILDNRGIINAVIDDARLSFSRYVEGIARHFGFDQTYSDPANNIYYSNPTQYGYLYDEDTEVALTINNPFNGSVATQGLWVSVLEKGDGFSAYYLSTKGFQPSKILDLVHSSGADYALIEGVDQALQITTHRIFEISIDERPVLNTPLPTSTTNRGLAFSYTLPSNLFSDTDSTLTISATTATGAALPTWLSFNPSTRTLSGTPTSGGTLNLAVSAADELGSVSAPLTLKVREVQSLSSNPAPIRYQRNKDLTVPINYSTTDGSSSTGLAFKVHFNSSLFSFDPVTGVSNKATADLFQIGAVQSDTSNTDGDATTDKFIPINVASFSGSFPSGATPIKLADLIFKAADKAIDPLTGLKDTKINFSETEAAQGYGFQGTGASLKPMSFNLDVDGDGKVTALGDGLMVIRHLFGSAFSGSALTDKAISPTSPFLGGVAYNTMNAEQKNQVASLVATNIQQGIDAGLLDVDKDGKITALGDALMVIRNLFGSAFSGTALIDKAISPTSPFLGGLTYATMTADQKLAASGLVTANIDALKPNLILELPSITLAVSTTSVLEDGAGNLVFSFTRTGATTNTLTVNYAITGTADSSDYTGATPGTGKTITFAANSATATLTIDPTADSSVEADETVALTLAAGTGYTVGTITAVAGTMTDTINDTSTAPTLVKQTFTYEALKAALGTGGSITDYGVRWSQYIQKIQQSDYVYLDQYFTSLTGKTFALASPALEPMLTTYQNTRARLYKISPTLFLGVADLSSNQPNYGEPETEFLYDTSASSGSSGIGYRISPLYSSTTTYDNNVKATTPVNPFFVVSQQGSLYAVKPPKGDGFNGSSEIYCYTPEGIAANGGATWIRSISNSYMGGDLRYNLVALPNGNIAATYTTVNGAAISILDSKNGSILSTDFFSETIAPGGYIELFSTSGGDLYGVARSFPNAPIKLLASMSPYLSSPVYFNTNMSGPTAGFAKNGDFILSANSSGQATYDATIIKAVDLPYLSTSFGNFNTTTDKDTLTGTSFADTFLFSTAPAFGVITADHITDFNGAQGDLLKISKSAFGMASNTTAIFVTVTTASGLTTALGSSNTFVYDSSVGYLYWNENKTSNGFGSGGVFAVLDNRPTLNPSNILLF